MRIFPHSDVEMWGRVRTSHFRRAWQSLNFDKEYTFGFETLVFATLQIFFMHQELATKILIASYNPFNVSYRWLCNEMCIVLASVMEMHSSNVFGGSFGIHVFYLQYFISVISF